MRIAYVCYWNLLERDGIAKKVNAHLAAWREAGHDVQVFCVSQAEAGAGVDLDWKVHRFDSTPLGRVRATQRLQDAVLSYRPDFLYFRYDLYLPPLGRLLRRLPSAVEINADDREEAKLVRGRAGRFYNELNRRALLARVDGLVCVTGELARAPGFARFGKPSAVIGNSVDLSRIVPAPPPSSARPRVLFLGSRLQPWHGVDKIVWLAERLPDVDFDLAGYLDRDFVGALPANVTVHGILSRAQYEPLIATADAGMGTLALHRKNMDEACPLKVREYLAYGLPVVLAYHDTDLGDLDEWFVLRLPNDEENVRAGADEIRAFLDRVRGRRVPRAAVEARIGTRAKEGRRLDFFQRLARQASSDS